jgi:hypothetical protein
MAQRDGRTYPGVGILRFSAVYDSGSLIELEDHSRWEVLPGNEVFTTHWVPRCAITVVPGSLSDYPYDLINPESGDRVPARFKGVPGSGWRLLEE